MPVKLTQDSTPSEKLLQMFVLLLTDGKKHFQQDLAKRFGCSNQTVIRLMNVIEKCFREMYVTGKESHRRWYQIRSPRPIKLDLEVELIRRIVLISDLEEVVDHTMPEGPSDEDIS